MPGFGWRRDQPDVRDLIWSPAVSIGVLPKRISLVSQCPPVRDQGQLGACTAFASTGAAEFATLKQGHDIGEPSELFTYYNTRLMEGTVPYDAGGTIRDAVKSINQYGCADEPAWPYDISEFTDKPPASVYTSALTQRALVYQRVTTIYNTKPISTIVRPFRQVLATGYPIVFGITVYESFMEAVDGIIPMPDQSEQPLGGHAIVLVGYDDTAQKFTFRNSWNTTWGQNGYGLLPYQYVGNPYLASDFWFIKTIGDKTVNDRRTEES